MSKRFTDTNIWEKAWFQELSLKHKCLWRYLCDRCDQAGVWDTNFRMASFVIGETVTEQDLVVFADRLRPLKDGKYHLTAFVEFQYGTLSSKCKPHQKVLSLLKKHNLSKGYAKGMDTLEEEAKSKDKEEDKDKDQDKGEDTPRSACKTPASIIGALDKLHDEPIFRSVTAEQLMRIRQANPDKDFDCVLDAAIAKGVMMDSLKNPAAWLFSFFKNEKPREKTPEELKAEYDARPKTERELKEDRINACINEISAMVPADHKAYFKKLAEDDPVFAHDVERRARSYEMIR